jgi:biotin carboxyl carrier protein
MGGRRPERGNGSVGAVSGPGTRGSDRADREPARIVDPRAVRVGVTAAGDGEVAPIVVEPPEVPLVPAPHVMGAGILGGISPERLVFAEAEGGDDGMAIVDGQPVRLWLDHQDDVHSRLTEITAAGAIRTSILLLPIGRPAGPSSGIVRREIVVDGWRIDVEIESERRASLRERARRGREELAHGGPTHVRAIIPGRIVSVSVVPGDPVEAGQQLLVVEAMKMQNELRAPRDGIVSSVAVGVGDTIEVGDLLLVLE